MNTCSLSLSLSAVAGGDEGKVHSGLRFRGEEEEEEGDGLAEDDGGEGGGGGRRWIKEGILLQRGQEVRMVDKVRESGRIREQRCQFLNLAPILVVFFLPEEILSQIRPIFFLAREKTKVKKKRCFKRCVWPTVIPSPLLATLLEGGGVQLGTSVVTVTKMLLQQLPGGLRTPGIKCFCWHSRVSNTAVVFGRLKSNLPSFFFFAPKNLGLCRLGQLVRRMKEHLKFGEVVSLSLSLSL